jgi:murein hydrolase activator
MKRILTLSLLFCGLMSTLSLSAQKKDSLEIEKLTKNFESMRGQVPCPLKSSHIDFKTLYLDENRKPTRGVDLIADSTSVSLPAGGYVTAIFPGDEGGKSVIVCHGNYFTVYSNLFDVLVKQGSDVKAGQLLGHAKRDDHMIPRLHFEIWFNSDHLWPPDWLACTPRK